ncbi:Oidioi.mRNA.OKI2018_I69.PAR.g9357.t1.cds [Oikopleura dioica]|uniref:Oidioi.mRNA.OKI2018_I69.PAR.g9357.t1.cds n=1 Tax=Oikopleura dioica TaxID=34765 RepID=A0ABN7RPA2_OIKDI|nr:Oidioi.mRNA.OKI2018_I69.PAR.g9357.t1.cds [Oikopleura dioica]
MKFFFLFSGISAVRISESRLETFQASSREEDCPDNLLQEECIGECRMDFTNCRLLCETEYCLSICDREYNDCLNSCPCGENCPEGCRNCDHPLCPEEEPYYDEPKPFVDLHNAYIIDGVGSKTVQATIDATKEQFMWGVKYALVNDILFVFGGEEAGMDFNHRRIAYLDGCSFVFLNSALTLADGDKAMICFEYTTQKKTCNYFDGEQVTIAPMTSYEHKYAGLDHPAALYGHSLMGLSDGTMLSIGGYDAIEETAVTDIDIWTLIGNLRKKVCKASTLQSGSSIFLFAGYGSDAPIQRIDLDGQENLGSRVIGYQPEEGVEYPVLFETTFDKCVEFL